MSKTESTMVTLGTQAPPFELLDVVSGRAMSRDDIFASAGEEARGLLIMFICVHCPYVKHVEVELARIGEDYEGMIAIAAIQSNDIESYPADGPDGMREQAARLKFRFAYLLDESQEVAREYDAACTPDFFLFNAALELVYRGQLDDSRPRRGDSGNNVPVTGKSTLCDGCPHSRHVPQPQSAHQPWLQYQVEGMTKPQSLPERAALGLVCHHVKALTAC